MKSFFAVCAFGFLASWPVDAALTPEQIASLPAPASHEVQFTKEIKPILEASCTKCHARGKDKGGFALDNRETLLKGGDSGPSVVIGKSAESYLIELVAGVDPDNVMPQKGSKLTPEQVGLMRAWIDQGLKWDEGVSFAKPEPRNLKPRQPELPPATKRVEHPIDRLLQPYFAQHNIQPARPVEDRIYARRVYLDVIGLLPPADELEAFVADKHPDKRARLARRLLDDRHNYAQHWFTFWNDMLRNDYRGTGYIDGGRKQITGWLYSALLTNMPYDQFVTELVNPTPGAEGFTKGIVWRGVVNASQTPQMQAAQNVSQVFMGVNLKCASCHDSFIDDWTLADAYGLAGIYADGPLEMVHCDKPTGKVADLKFLYPSLGRIDASADRAERVRQLADIIAQPDNGRLSRTIVNRLWARFMGRGLVEPVDIMENPAWNTDVLDWLAEDLVANGYDLKKTIERILTSQAYQLPAVNAAENEREEYVFRGPLVRRMTAEQFRDAIGMITGVWYTQPNATIEALRDEDAAIEEAQLKARWIWSVAEANTKAPAQTIYLRKTFDLPAAPNEAAAMVVCDNNYTLFVNGRRAGAGKDFNNPQVIDISKHLRKGKNLIAVAAVNHTAKNELPSDTEPPQAADDNPAGFFFQAFVKCEAAGNGPVAVAVRSDASWQWSLEKQAGWNELKFDASGWQAAVELGDMNLAPWKYGNKFAATWAAVPLRGQIRASLVTADPLMLALGRPNREQVITTRASDATTLQALELTNGGTLSDILKRGAAQLVNGGKVEGRALVRRIYAQSLSRKPTSEELSLARELVGQPVRPEGVEDLLWAVAMLPEFQLIY